MDNLSCALNHPNIGGYIGGEIVNHLSYADDLCLICLSSAGIIQLLSVCSFYTTEHSISYNDHIMQTSRIHCALKPKQ